MKIASLLAAASFAFVAAAPALAQPGQLDPTFGNGGINTVQLPHDHWPYAVSASPADGGIAVAGVSWVPQGRNMVSHLGVVRFNADGSLDSSFGNGGYAHHNLGGAISSSSKLAVQNDGKIVFSRSPWFPIVRLNTNGSLDSSFGSSGVVNAPTSGDNWTVRDFTFTPDGKILTVGSRSLKLRGNQYGPTNTAMMRYNANGTLDSTFGSGGVIVYQYSSGTDFATDVVSMPDGRFVTRSAEQDAGGVWRSWFSRYHANGTLDSSFGIGGRVLYQAQIYDNEGPTTLDVAQDGSILSWVTMHHDGQPVPRPGYIRLHADGSLDTTFGDGGLSHPEVEWATGGRGAERQHDGAIVTVCSADPGTGNHLMMLRMTADGQIDTSYGPHGNGTSVLVPWTSGIGLHYNLDGMDRAIAAGRVAGAANNQISVARFQSE
jgi:uncharacterized delta-60 repeat protein